ncbi:MAG: S1C family serine protease, partial [Patescibacteria group bacterium]
VFIFAAAFLSGIAAALVTVAWIAPTFVPADYYNTNRDLKNNNRPDPLLVRQVKQRVIDVYDKRQKTDKVLYGQKARVTQAGLLSSDGWAVAFYPSYLSGEEKNWEAADYQGVLYGITKAIYDPISRLLYFKLSGQGFRVMSFGNSASLTDENLWTIDNNGGGKEVILGELTAIDSKKIYPIWRAQSFAAISSGASVGEFVFGAQGESFGVVDERGEIIPAWLIDSQIGSLLEKQVVSYNGVPWRGYIVDGVNKDGVWTSLTGFYVIESGGLAKADTINRGDVVLKINSRSVSSQDAAEQISSAQEEFKVVVWRKGKEMEVVVNKVVVK